MMQPNSTCCLSVSLWAGPKGKSWLSQNSPFWTHETQIHTDPLISTHFVSTFRISQQSSSIPWRKFYIKCLFAACPSLHRSHKQSSKQECVCTNICVFGRSGGCVDSYYSVWAGPNNSRIFVYSSPLLFSHRIDEKDTRIKHIVFGRHGSTKPRTHTDAVGPTKVTFQMQMEQQLPSTAKMSTSSALSLCFWDEPSWQQVCLHVTACWWKHTRTHTSCAPRSHYSICWRI